MKSGKNGKNAQGSMVSMAPANAAVANAQGATAPVANAMEDARTPSGGFEGSRAHLAQLAKSNAETVTAADPVENLLRAAEGCAERPRRKVYQLKDFVPATPGKSVVTPLSAMEQMQKARRERRRRERRHLAEQFELPIAEGSPAVDVEFKTETPPCECDLCLEMRANDGARAKGLAGAGRAAEILAQATIAHELLEGCWMGANMTEAISFAQSRIRRIQEVAEAMLR